MINHYSKNPKFYIAVDCIIFGFNKDKLSLLLIKRNFKPSIGKWSLVGGFVQENESAEDAAKRVLKDLTGLDEVYMDQVGVFSDVDRDPGGRVVSVAFCALLNMELYDKKLGCQNNAHWESIDNIPELIFDHKKMIQQSLRMLRRKATTEPVGFNLLPELFTLTQFQQLYEAIYGHEIDKRNFRNKVLTMPFVEKTDQIDKVTSKRGAALYRFNQNIYLDEPKFKL